MVAREHPHRRVLRQLVDPRAHGHGRRVVDDAALGRQVTGNDDVVRLMLACVLDDPRARCLEVGQRGLVEVDVGRVQDHHGATPFVHMNDVLR